MGHRPQSLSEPLETLRNGETAQLREALLWATDRNPEIKGPDNPTSQLLPILSFKSSSGDGEGKTKEVVKDCV